MRELAELVYHLALGRMYNVRPGAGGVAMASLVTGERLLAAVKSQTFIKGAEKKCTEGVKYDLRMGHRVLKAGGLPIDTLKLTEAERSQLSLEPGEMAFVLSEETLALPRNMAAVLSPKRKLAHEGILVLGGFFIDPLYEGNLLVGLYNFSTVRWPLQPGNKLIAVVFYTLNDEELAEFAPPEAAIHDFPHDLVRAMQNYRPVMLEALQEALRATQKEMVDLREEFRSQEDWKKTFRESLDRHDTQIDRLLGGIAEVKESLKEEMKNRQVVEQALDQRLIVLGGEVTQISQRTRRRRELIIAVLAAILGAVVGALMTPLLTGLLSSLR